ncbi:MAG: hypothetical protein KUG77_30065 [Nannocystaceae bacterium]|nr:hypothetical protein [Nannocystaceae bacterium]
MELRSFYFGHPDLLVVPVEHLSRSGVEPEFVRVAQGEREIPPGFFELLSESVATYFARVDSLFAAGRAQWFPPRLLNLCVATTPKLARLYYQPFVGASLLLHESDFDPKTSNVEMGTYQLVHAERLGITRNVASTVLGNLGYFIRCSELERDRFAQAAARSTRPDAEAFLALGEAMAWVGGLLHETLKPALLHSDGLTSIPGTGLLVTDAQTLKIGALVEVFERVGKGALERYYAAEAAPMGEQSPADRVGRYLLEQQPRLLLADRDGRVIWDPDDAQELGGLGSALESMCDRAAIGVCRDLGLVAERTQQVLDRLAEPDELPFHAEEVEQKDGAYLHEQRRMMVYSLRQPGVDTEREGTPPFHRWLLGARVGHEFGHLAAEADLVRVPPDKQRRHDEALEELAGLFDSIIIRAPQALQAQVQEQFSARPAAQSVGEAMVAMQMLRIGDYESNVFAQAVLPTVEMEAYVRVNVRTLAQESFSFLGKLARYAYEYQYLGFSKMPNPRHYFYASTWFPDNYIKTGVLSEEEAGLMLDLMAEVCTSHQLVPGALRDYSS